MLPCNTKVSIVEIIYLNDSAKRKADVCDNDLECEEGKKVRV